MNVAVMRSERTWRVGKDAPLGRAAQRTGAIVGIPILSGLHHHYGCQGGNSLAASRLKGPLGARAELHVKRLSVGSVVVERCQVARGARTANLSSVFPIGVNGITRWIDQDRVAICGVENRSMTLKGELR